LVEPTPLSALRGRLAAVLVGGFLVDDVDGRGDALLGPVDGDADAGGMTTVCGTDCPLDEGAAPAGCPADDMHAATSASATSNATAAPTRVARRAVIVVSRCIGARLRRPATVMLRAIGRRTGRDRHRRPAMSTRWRNA
jgi:hypothetical protein